MDDLLHFVRHEVAMDGDDGESKTHTPEGASQRCKAVSTLHVVTAVTCIQATPCWQPPSHFSLSRRHASISPKNCLHEPDFRVNKQGNHASKSTQAACSMRLDGKNILYTQSNSLNTTMLLETYTDALYFVSFTVFLCVTILQVLPLIDWIPSSTPTMQEQPKITTTMDHPHPFLLRI